MSEEHDLDAQVAQYLFGWQWLAGTQLWRDPDGLVCDAQAFRRQLPAYSRVPDATALVWQWLEQQGFVREISVEYPSTPPEVVCTLYLGPPFLGSLSGHGARWPEALCRAALALARHLGETAVPRGGLPQAIADVAARCEHEHRTREGGG